MASSERHKQHLSSYLKSKKESPSKAASTSRVSNKSARQLQKSPSSNSQHGHAKTAYKLRSRGNQANIMDRLPDELLVSIFKLLSPSQLLVCGQVCRRWADMTKDGALWEGIFPKLPPAVRKLFTFEETKTEGFNWKREIIKRCIKARNNIVFAPGKARPKVYHGMPDLQGHLKFLSIKWKLCVTDTSGNEHWATANAMLYFASSVSVQWRSINIPPLPQLKTMKIYAFVPVFYNKEWKPHSRSAMSRSLLLQYNLKDCRLKKNSALAEDDMITTHTLPHGVVLACWKASWKDGGEVAFVTANLHRGEALFGMVNIRRGNQHLPKRLLLGSATEMYKETPHMPVFDDIDPHYGLHGYTAEIALRDNGCSFWSHHYRVLDRGDLMADSVVFSSPGVVHGCFWQKVMLPWATELFKGTLQNVCILDLTVLDEHKKPMWCVSTLVTAKESSEPDVDYSNNGTKYVMEYSDDKGSLYIDLVWDSEDLPRMNVIKTHFHIRKAFINQWFGTSH